MQTLDSYYHPVPFPEYKDVYTGRKDSEDRYQAIKKSYGDFKGKTLIDICCANGYFSFRFLQDGGKLARGIEELRKRKEFVNALALEKNMALICDTSLDGLKDCDFDIGIYLDTHYHTGTKEYPEYLTKHTKVLFTSCANRNNYGANQNYVLLLKKLFKNVESIHQGYAGRIIYKCYTVRCCRIEYSSTLICRCTVSNDAIT